MADYPVKQVIVMRKDLNMRKGKMIAQGSHASMSWMVPYLRAIQTNNPNDIPLMSNVQYLWLDGRFTKICVYVESEEALLAIHERAKSLSIHSELVQDAGFTEFGGVPTYTCCAIGPDFNEKIDVITGGLPLL